MITINTDEDVKKLFKEKEQRDLEALRASLRLSSYRDGEERLEQVRLACETALRVLEEAYLSYDEDEPNVERAIEQAHDLENIERQFDRCMRAWERQLKRIEWERKQANAIR